ncbi:MAG: type II toxin-antitoxin system HicA family toxin [Gammaproteobacteria bacterium]|nr:type II toxin-antitoxin system HicA family toxin [Gammaproteobacteria bacterium]
MCMLKEGGWCHIETKGRHRQFSHPNKPGRVTVPHPNKDLRLVTVISIYRQTGWRT